MQNITYRLFEALTEMLIYYADHAQYDDTDKQKEARCVLNAAKTALKAQEQLKPGDTSGYYFKSVIDIVSKRIEQFKEPVSVRD